MCKATIGFAIGAGLAAACDAPSSDAGADADAVPPSAPAAEDGDRRAANLDFVLQDMHGADVRLSDYVGNVILIDFWATWCAPCRIEIPGFIELLDRYGEQGFVVLGISVDDTPEAMQAFAEELDIDYPLLVGLDRDDVKAAYGPLVGFPTSFVIDRSGDISASHTGFAPKAQFEQDILAVL